MPTIMSHIASSVFVDISSSSIKKYSQFNNNSESLLKQDSFAKNHAGKRRYGLDDATRSKEHKNRGCCRSGVISRNNTLLNFVHRDDAISVVK